MFEQSQNWDKNGMATVYGRTSKGTPAEADPSLASLEAADEGMIDKVNNWLWISIFTSENHKPYKTGKVIQRRQQRMKKREPHRKCHTVCLGVFPASINFSRCCTLLNCESW
jgi:hypothetical protein